VNKAQSVQAFAGKRPQLAEDVFVAPNASVVGDVKLGRGASIWYGAIVRGESPHSKACKAQATAKQCALHTHMLLALQVGTWPALLCF
jgi:carbonic anhydrase/acetyltransferase-like protein (isoleucine patch superfamily)